MRHTALWALFCALRDEVLAFHADGVAIEHRLTPIIVCMAGSDVRDPYKD